MNIKFNKYVARKGQYLNETFNTYLLKEGLKHNPIPPHSPEINGVAERAKQNLGEKG